MTELTLYRFETPDGQYVDIEAPSEAQARQRFGAFLDQQGQSWTPPEPPSSYEAGYAGGRARLGAQQSSTVRPRPTFGGLVPTFEEMDQFEFGRAIGQAQPDPLLPFTTFAMSRTGNFGDEAVSALHAGGAFLNNLARPGPDRLGRAQQAAGDTFDYTQGFFQGQLEQAQSEFPVTSLVGGVAGGIGFGSGFVGGAQTAGGAAVRGGLAGGLFGAGAGNSAEERAGNAAGSALFGAALAPLAPVVTNLAGSAVRSTGRQIGRVLGNTPQRQAAAILARDIADAGLTLDDVAAAAAQRRQMGIPAVMADSGVGGRQAMMRARGVAVRPGVAAGMAQDLAETRGAPMAVSSRVMEGVRQDAGIDPRLARGQIADYAAEAQARAAPLYQQVYSAPFEPTPALRRMVAEDPKLFNDARTSVARVASMTGAPAPAPLLPPRPRAHSTIRATGAGARFARPAAPSSPPPSGPMPRSPMESYDVAKRMLDDATERAVAQMEYEKARAAGLRAAGLREELKRIVPGYEDALRAGGEAPRLRAALAEGERVFGRTVDPRELADEVAQMSAPEVEALRAGAARTIGRSAEVGAFRPRAYQTADAQQKLATIFGEDTAERLSMRLAAEADTAASQNYFNPARGSPTMGAAEFGEAAPATGPFTQILRTISTPRDAALRAVSAIENALFRSGRGMTRAERDALAEMLFRDPDFALSILRAEPEGAAGVLGAMQRFTIDPSVARAGFGATQPAAAQYGAPNQERPTSAQQSALAAALMNEPDR